MIKAHTPLTYRQRDPFHDTLKQLIGEPHDGYLWGQYCGLVVPLLAGTAYGDGRALIGISTIHSRPWFYVIRIDSTWWIDGDDWRADRPDDKDFRCFTGQIMRDLEEEFGDGNDPDYGDIEDWEAECETLRAQGIAHDKLPPEPEPRDWPALSDRDGYSWWRKKWPALCDVPVTVPHPLSWKGDLLMPGFGDPQPWPRPRIR